jgi:hypothetical protein
MQKAQSNGRCSGSANEPYRAGPGKKTGGGHSPDGRQSDLHNVSRQVLARRLAELKVEGDLIQWTSSFIANRRVKLGLDSEEGDARTVETGIPQGSPVAPILFVTYLSSIFEEVEKVCEAKALSFADDVAWWAEGKNGKEVAERLAKASEAACDWADRNGMSFDHGNLCMEQF